MLELLTKSLYSAEFLELMKWILVEQILAQYFTLNKFGVQSIQFFRLNVCYSILKVKGSFQAYFEMNPH